jgi:predicted dehydrogenase
MTTSRRAFLNTALALPVLGANNRLKVGWIGAGMRGYHVLNQVFLDSRDLVEVVAVCDAYTGNRNRAQSTVRQLGGNTPRACVDYRELLADPAIDVVFICTPEHLHHRMALDALAQRKHIYLEKPIGHTVAEGVDVVRAAARAGTVVQVGTQNRSNKLYLQARQMVADGLIGDVHYVRAFWYRNFDPQGAVPAPWRYAIPPDAGPDTADWTRFLGSAPKRPWDKRRYFQWRNYWDYSGGIATDLLVHQTDITNFVLNRGLPSSCVASGGIYHWGAPDDREVPDTLTATYEYPADRFHLNYSCFFANDNYGYGEQFLGYKGTIEVLDRQRLTFSAQPKFVRGAHFSTHPDVHLDYLKDFHQPDATAAHVHNFLQAVLGKEKPIAPPEVGQQAAIPGHMATQAFRENRKVYY